MLHIHKNNLSGRLFFQMIITYLLVASLPIIINMNNYRQIAQNKQREEYLQLEARLNQAKHSFEKRMGELDALVGVIISDDMLTLFPNAANPLIIQDQVYNLIEIQNRLSIFRLVKSANDINDIYLYNEANNVGITTMNTYLRDDNFYRLNDIGTIGHDWKDFQETFLSGRKYVKKWIALDMEQSEKICMLFIHTLTNRTTKNSTYLIIPLRRSVIEGIFKDAMLDKYFVYDSQGNLICGDKRMFESVYLLRDATGMEQITIEQTAYIQANIASNSGEYHFAALLPQSVVDAGLAPIRQSMVPLWVMVGITTLLLCTWFAYVNYKPLNETLSLLFGSNKDDIFAAMGRKALSSGVIRIMDENEKLAHSISQQKSYIKNNLINDLLISGTLNSEGVIRKYKDLGIDMPDGNYWIVIISILQANAYELEPAFLSELARLYFPTAFHVYDASFQCVAAIVPDKGNSRYDIESAFHRMHQAAFHESGYGLHGAACLAESTQAITLAYHNAMIALHQGANTMGAFHWFDEIQIQSQEIYFPIALEHRILSSLLQGDYSSFCGALDEVSRENIKKRQLVGVRMQVLMERVNATLIQGVFNMSGIDEHEKLSAAQTISKLKILSNMDDGFQGIKSQISRLLEIRKQNIKANRLGEHIQAYICEHLCDSELCLGMVADHFGLTEAYVSSRLKQEVGEGFIAFCERQRVERSFEMLLQGIQVNEVARLVGYSSPHTFRRAFKKVTGRLPSEYVNQGTSANIE